MLLTRTAHSHKIFTSEKSRKGRNLLKEHADHRSLATRKRATALLKLLEAFFLLFFNRRVERVEFQLFKVEFLFPFLFPETSVLFRGVRRSARRDGIALTTDTLTHSPSRRATTQAFPPPTQPTAYQLRVLSRGLVLWKVSRKCPVNLSVPSRNSLQLMAARNVC